MNALGRDTIATVTDDVTGIAFNLKMDGPLWERTVTVYDARFPAFGPLGQKVRTIDAAGIYRLDRKAGGWRMQGDVPDWFLSARTIHRIADWFMLNE